MLKKNGRFDIWTIINNQILRTPTPDISQFNELHMAS